MQRTYEFFDFNGEIAEQLASDAAKFDFTIVDQGYSQDGYYRFTLQGPEHNLLDWEVFYDVEPGEVFGPE